MEEEKSITSIILALSPIIVSIIALVFSYLANLKLSNQKEKEIRNNYELKIKEIRADFELKKKEYIYQNQHFERNEIYKRLNDFYAPLLILRRTSKELHELFKNGKKFRTLPKLIAGTEYKNNDKVLIEEIIKIGNQCKKIIINKSGLIDDDDLREIHMPKLLTHYMLIDKAYNNEIKNEVERFEGYEFPNEIDDILDNKVRDLICKLDVLNRSVERKTVKEI